MCVVFIWCGAGVLYYRLTAGDGAVDDAAGGVEETYEDDEEVDTEDVDTEDGVSKSEPPARGAAVS